MSISCRVITPVGPGHEDIVEGAIASVQAAAAHAAGPFDGIEHAVVGDAFGEWGRGRARNEAMWGDWMFFLDADDVMMPDAFEWVDLDAAATFGAICVDGRVTEANKYPCGWDEIRKHGARGTLCMGFFYKGDLRFNEDMIVGEDFDFYMRLPSFTKVRAPLVSIGRSVPSAGGPKGYSKVDWQGQCQKVIASHH